MEFASRSKFRYQDLDAFRAMFSVRPVRIRVGKIKNRGIKLFIEKGRKNFGPPRPKSELSEAVSAVELESGVSNGHASMGENPGTALIVAELNGDKSMRRKITEIGALPAIPKIYNKMICQSKSETGSLENVAEIIAADPEMTSKILKLVNSHDFNLHIRLKSPLHALSFLGFDIISALVLFEGMFAQFTAERPARNFIGSVHDHSLAVGISAYKISKSITPNGAFPLDSLIAGLLHDVGKIIMLANFRAEVDEAVTAVENRLVPLHEIEYEMIGITHAFIGAYLATLWGLSDSVIEAVALHHLPRDSTDPTRSVLAAVHIADALEHERGRNSIQGRLVTVDIEYLKDLGILEKLPQLKEECTMEADLETEKIILAKLL